ncbi:MAG TPA: MmgE/PrpD family protein [Burkholderiales bacterium]|nr:MmgE/PrpD family protein [Burkholderiales bacterium]
MAGATERVASFIAATSLDHLPAEAVDKAKKAIADTFAAILAGAGSEVAHPLMTYGERMRAAGEVPMLGTGVTASPETAALVNGTFGHALDYDDVLSMMPAHPSAVILAAAIAKGLHGATGRDLIEAYVLGVEVGGKIGVGMTVGHYQRGYHATGTLALFSALAALLKLHRVDVAIACQAFGIAASMASGLRRNFGTMTKPLHTGIAARSALTACELAASGFTAAPDILEAKAGLYSTLGVAESSADVTATRLGKPFVIVDPGLALKKFPCCYASHRAMDGLLSLREELKFDATSVEKIVCRMPPGGMHVLTYPKPVTGLEAKFSLPYPLAAAALDGAFSLWTFTDEAVKRPEILALYGRIDAHEDAACRGDDPEFDQRSSGSRGFVEVEVRLRDGRSGRVRVDKAPGSPARELSWADLERKFADCASHSKTVDPDKARRAFEMIRRLDELSEVEQLIDLLR